MVSGTLHEEIERISLVSGYEREIYATPAHSLPSARGQGEPLTGQFKPKDGADFIGIVIRKPGSCIAL